MFAGIAQRVLNNVVGEYIDGLDSKNINVGIWSGDFTIENVAVKAESLEKFNLPINIKFSHIGRVWASIPWKNLSSSPVEVELQDVLIVASPKSRQDLINIGLDLVNDRKKTLDAYAAMVEESFRKGIV